MTLSQFNVSRRAPKIISAAPCGAAEKEALVLPMCQLRQGNGLRSLLCLDSGVSQLDQTANRNPKS